MNWGPRTLGSLLRPEVQRDALNRFIYRYTGDHKPAWTTKPRPCGRPYPMFYANDQEWLSNTVFRTNKDGTLSRRHHFCESRTPARLRCSSPMGVEHKA